MSPETWIKKLSTQGKTGWSVTVIWLAIGVSYVIFIYGACEFVNLAPNYLGDFFAGLFAPVAFLWLVLGYFQQGEELKQNTEALRQQYDEMKRSADESAKQSKAITLNEQHARLQTLMDAYKIITNDLCNLSAIMIDHFKLLDSLGKEKGWSIVSSGYTAYFAREIVRNLNIQGSFTIISERIRENDDQNSLILEYLEKFDRLMLISNDFDETGIMTKTLQQSDFASLAKKLRVIDLS